MLSCLQNHPFAVRAFFEQSLVITYAVPQEQLQNLVPESLRLDTYDDQWAFIAVAMVDTKHLRPAIFPECFGNDFLLMGYRIFVRYRTADGREKRGLYILGSETDKLKMSILGNVFTKYRYKHTPISWTREANGTQQVESENGMKIRVNAELETIALPEGSPFPDWRAARRFAGPMPFTFSYDNVKNRMTIVEGMRQKWTPDPVHVLEAKIPLIESLHLKGARLANAFMVKNVPYYWKKGVVETCK